MLFYARLRSNLKDPEDKITIKISGCNFKPVDKRALLLQHYILYSHGGLEVKLEKYPNTTQFKKCKKKKPSHLQQQLPPYISKHDFKQSFIIIIIIIIINQEWQEHAFFWGGG